MARGKRDDSLDAPKGLRTSVIPRRDPLEQSDRFGRFTEWIARAMGTPWFILGLTIFVVAWMAWNTLAPNPWRFDSAALGFIALTLVLSLQASYAAPLILLAQNRQDDRDRVNLEADREEARESKADLEYLARELAAVRMALGEVATRDFLRSELGRAEQARELREREAEAESAAEAG